MHAGIEAQSHGQNDKNGAHGIRSGDAVGERRRIAEPGDLTFGRCASWRRVPVDVSRLRHGHRRQDDKQHYHHRRRGPTLSPFQGWDVLHCCRHVEDRDAAKDQAEEKRCKAFAKSEAVCYWCIQNPAGWCGARVKGGVCAGQQKPTRPTEKITCEANDCQLERMKKRKIPPFPTRSVFASCVLGYEVAGC